MIQYSDNHDCKGRNNEIKCRVEANISKEVDSVIKSLKRVFRIQLISQHIVQMMLADKNPTNRNFFIQKHYLPMRTL